MGNASRGATPKDHDAAAALARGEGAGASQRQPYYMEQTMPGGRRGAKHRRILSNSPDLRVGALPQLAFVKCGPSYAARVPRTWRCCFVTR